MKLIVAGGRDYEDQAIIDFVLNGIHATYGITEIVSGGCKGVDECGEVWAEKKNIPVKHFIPDWVASGKRAGPLRNQEMAEYADGCIVFPGGRGTNDMADRAQFRRMEFWDFRQNSPAKEKE